MQPYQKILDELKQKIRESRINTVIEVNYQLLAIYFEIGKVISQLENNQGWGAKVVEKLSFDLRSEFSDMTGFSVRNLRYMRDFHEAYPYFPFLQASLAKSDDAGSTTSQNSILQAPLAKLTWYHHITLITKIKDTEIRKFYVEQTIENGWSRDVMVNQIEGQLHLRAGKITSNFATALTSQQSDLVQQVFKDPYKFDFIYLGAEAKERDLENALTNQLIKLLPELGKWFAFMGKQYKILVGEKEYFYDLLFYHTRLKRYIIIDLKIGDFKPESLGKMEFYLTVADKQLKAEGDNESIGLILCKTKDGLVAEYALLDSKKPVGIAEYKFNELLPENIKGELPEIEEIEQRMIDELNDLRTPTQKRMDRLKETLASLNRKEVTTGATNDLLSKIFDESIKPMHEELLSRLEEFKSAFITVSAGWTISNRMVSSIDALEVAWKQENLLKSYRITPFICRLEGLKKAGVNAVDIVVTLNFQMDTYWYGMSLINHNNNQPFIRKAYDEMLSINEIQQICDSVCDQIITSIETRLDLA